MPSLADKSARGNRLACWGTDDTRAPWRFQDHNTGDIGRVAVDYTCTMRTCSSDLCISRRGHPKRFANSAHSSRLERPRPE
jgi:hypothetical protein